MYTIQVKSSTLGWTDMYTFEGTAEKAALMLVSFENKWPNRQFRLK